MKTLFATLTAAAALAAVAAPASAQPRDYDGGRHASSRYDQRHDEYRGDDNRWDRGAYNINQRQEVLNRQIAVGIRSGSLTRSEASRLVRESRDIARLEARYRHNGLSRAERADLDRRFDRLEARVRHDRRDRDRNYGSGYYR